MSLIKGAKSKPLPKFQKPENEFLTHSQKNDDVMTKKIVIIIVIKMMKK